MKKLDKYGLQLDSTREYTLFTLFIPFANLKNKQNMSVNNNNATTQCIYPIRWA